jgi:hypothetical protein
MNSKDVTTTTLAAQAAEHAAYRRDFKVGYRKFWSNDNLFYCANNAERAGFWAAAAEAHAETQRAREHAADVRQMMGN